MTRFETIAIGDELLCGKIADTNSAFVADSLYRRGRRVNYITVIADDPEQIKNTLRARAENADAVICFGGLGPTSDDRTAQTVAQLLGCELVTDDASRIRLEAFGRERGRTITPQMLKQVRLPAAADSIANPAGLAVGFSCVLGTCRFFFLPGVPSEMKAMWSQTVLPWLEKQKSDSDLSLWTHTWKLLGIPESELQRTMDPIEARLPGHAWLGYRTKFPENHLTLYFRAPESGRPPSEFTELETSIRTLLQPWTYTEADEELEKMVLQQLRRKNFRIVLAESCTAGLATHRLTRVPGSSQWVWGGYSCYQTQSKATMLNVQIDKSEDAVSAACSRSLAEQALKISGCDIAAAITGYMGPGGGTPNDPPGAFYLCVVARGRAVWEKKVLQLAREREATQWGASTHLLNSIRSYLEEIK